MQYAALLQLLPLKPKDKVVCIPYEWIGGGGFAIQLHPFLTFTLGEVSGQSNVVKKRINRLSD